MAIITDKRILNSDDTKVLDVGRISHIMIPKLCPLHNSFKRTHTTYATSSTLDVYWNSWDPKYPERVGLAWISLDTPAKSRQQDAISFDALNFGLSHLLRRGECALREDFFHFLLSITSEMGIHISVDAFASEQDHFLPRFWSMKDNAFGYSWIFHGK